MAKTERVPLAWAITQPKYLKPIWDMFSTPQKVFIKAAYGLPIEGEAEEKAWAMFNGACEYDELGFITKWWPVPYEAGKEYTEIVGLLGRRAGKSLLTCFMVLYEAVFGGHTAHVLDGTEILIPYVAQDLNTAKANMKAILQLAKMVPAIDRLVDDSNKDEIRFSNGVIIKAEPPSVKTGRGFSIPIVIMDEVGFWYNTSENVNPDYEVQRALLYSQGQFPHFKQFIISTPYTEEGLLWDYAKAGTSGQNLSSEEQAEYKDAIVMRGSTAGMENPEMMKLGRRQFEKLQAKDDPMVFMRESLAMFTTSESNFIPGPLVDENTDKGVKVRRRKDVEHGGLVPSYVAVMDPAFRHDDFVFTIGHRDAKGNIVQDFMHIWSPDRKKGIRLNPDTILWQIGEWLKEWNTPVVYSDQYQLETLQQIAQNKYKFSIIGHDFTGRSKAKIYGSLEQLLRTKRLRLLDIPETRQQLSMLNKVHTALGNVQIGAPKNRKDDVATAVALLAHIGQQMLPQVKDVPKEMSVYDQIMAQYQSRQKGERWDF